jgi:DnaJ-class molecular chaperone
MTKIIETCEACMGFGQLEIGCDIEEMTSCHHCGGWGTITTETSDDSDVAPPTWRVVTYPKIVKSNFTSFCEYSKSFASHSDAEAFAANVDADDVALIFTEDDLDGWIVEHSQWEMDAESDPIEVFAGINESIADLEDAIIEVAKTTEDVAMLKRQIAVSKGQRNSIIKNYSK